MTIYMLEIISDRSW